MIGVYGKTQRAWRREEDDRALLYVITDASQARSSLALHTFQGTFSNANVLSPQLCS